MSATYPSGRIVQYKYDGVGNRLEMVEGTTSGPAGATGAGDQDCDGVFDLNDNCPTVSNPSQTDTDAPSLPTGLVAGYALDETTGEFVIRDVTGRNDGSMNYGPGHVPGKHGNALEVVVPSDHRVRIPTSPSLEALGSELTLASWVKPVASSFTSGTILSKQQSFALFLGNNGATFHAQLSTPNAGIFTSQSLIPVGQWSHVAVTVKGGRVKFYVNGAPAGDFS